MKRRIFRNLSTLLGIIYFIFAVLSLIYNFGLGTAATFGGVAMMFVWMSQQENLKD